MEQTCYKKLDSLKDFLEHNPSIRFDEVISIPHDLKPEFLKNLDDLRDEIINQKVGSDKLNNAIELGNQYHKLEREIIKLYQLRGVRLESKVCKFVNDPRGCLREELYFSILDTLNGNKDNALKDKADKLLSVYDELMNVAIGKCFALAILRYSNANNLMAAAHGDIHPYRYVHQHPFPTRPHPIKVYHVDFFVNRERPYICPDYIVYLPELGTYMAVRTVIERGKVKFADDCLRSKHLEWKTISPKLDYFNNNSVHLYFSEDLSDLTLLAEKDFKICCPSAIISYKYNNHWSITELSNNIFDLKDSVSPSLICLANVIINTGKVSSIDSPDFKKVQMHEDNEDIVIVNIPDNFSQVSNILKLCFKQLKLTPVKGNKHHSIFGIIKKLLNYFRIAR